MIERLNSTAPSVAPSNFKASIVTSTSVTLTWDPLPIDDQNGVILYYAIDVTVKETEEQFQLTSNTTSLEVTDLPPFRTFVCVIAAATSAGLGPIGPTYTVVTLEDSKEFSKLFCDTIFIFMYLLF